MASSPTADRLAQLDALARLAAHAGRILMAAPRRSGVEIKPDGSPVTPADIACEKALAKGVAEIIPGVAIVGEESASANGRLPPDRQAILIDPLDGTRAFIDGRDDFCICVALVEDGVPILGVLGAPARGRVYAGFAGPSAVSWRATVDSAGDLAAQRTPLGVRRGRRPPVGLASERHGDPASAAVLARIGATAPTSLSSALKFAALAEGEADIYPRLAPTMGWDTAAGQCILAAAGGETWDAAGRPLRYDPGAPLRNPGFIACGDTALREAVFG